MNGLLKKYYELTKPGIIYGNLLTAGAGFLFGSKWHVNFWHFISLLIGMSLVIGSACVFNNYIDREIDNKMSRTKKRALVTKDIAAKNAIVYGTVLGLIGLIILIFGTNLIVLVVGAVAFFDYVVLYGYYKRRSIYGTLVGSISGASPILAGYTAATDRLDREALILFLIMIFWQMPHFYAIAMSRFEDYKAAGLPVLPVRQGMKITKKHIFVYIIAFILAIVSLKLYGGASDSFLAVMLVLSLVWLFKSYKGFNVANDQKWARNMFLFSLIVILGLSIMLAFDPLLP